MRVSIGRLPRKLERIKGFLEKAPRILAEKAFFTFLTLFLLALIFTGFLFYKNVFLIKKIQPEIFEKPLQFNEKLLEEILKEQENRQRKFEEVDSKQYPNPFQGPISPGEMSPGGLTQ